MYYILDGKIAVKTDDIKAWATMDIESKIVKKTKIGDATVSTVFLGLDHGYNGKPLLFETMVFGGEYDGEIERYETWEEAEKGHNKMCEIVKT